MTEVYNNAIFWIEVDKIQPNPYQPRQEFNEDRLRDLADSIRQYGVLQPLVVTRQEREREDGGLYVVYELIAGERRLRASKIAGVTRVPAVIRSGEDTDKMKLEMAIIENLQREDLNPVDRAQAFQKLVIEFNLKHTEVAKKVGKSREYISNSIRILALPQEILDGVIGGKITEGHTRPILMLADRPEEQMTLYKEVVYKKLTVRETEAIARRIAYDRVRKKEQFIEPEIIEKEERLTEKFGTRVKVEKKDVGGKVVIDFFSNEDLHKILNMLSTSRAEELAVTGMAAEAAEDVVLEVAIDDLPRAEAPIIDSASEAVAVGTEGANPAAEEDDLYNIRNFSL